MAGGGTYNEISGGIFLSAVVQGRDITINLPPEIPLALRGLPAASPAFVGRETELDALFEMLAPCADTADGAAPWVTVTAVGGLAGVGKTELAVQAAHAGLERGWFPGGVLFADLFGYDPARRVEPTRALEGFLRALGVPGQHIPPQEADRARLYASVLAAFAEQGRRVLVVIDNAATAEQVKPLLPADRGTPVVITSRHTLSMLDTRLLDLAALDPPDAALLLDRVLRMARPDDSRVGEGPDEAAEISRLCGGLPLALRIVAALLADDPARPMRTMTAALSRSESRLDEIRHSEVSVWTAFELSYRHLASDQARALRLLTLNPGPDVSTVAAAALTGLGAETAGRLMDALARAHLIERSGAYGRWRLHDLVRLFAERAGQDNSDADGRGAARDALLAYYVCHTQDAARHLDPADENAADGAFADQDAAFSWLDAEYANLKAAVAMAQDVEDPESVRDLCRALGNYFLRRRHYADMEALCRTAVEASRTLGDAAGEGRALANLGLALQQSGQPDKALPVCEEAVRVCHGSGDRATEFRALNNLGWALRGSGRYDEAIDAHRRDLEFREETGDRLGQAIAWNGIGSAASDGSRTRESIDAHRESARIFRELGELRGSAMALNNMGMTLTDMDAPGEALAAHEEAMELALAIGDRQEEGKACLGIGVVQSGLGRHDDAISMFREAARLFNETNDLEDELRSLDNACIALYEAGRYEETIEACRGLIARYRENGKRHGTAQILDILGNALRETRRPEEAIAAYEESAELFHDLGNTPEYLREVNNIQEIRHALRPLSRVLSVMRPYRRGKRSSS